MAAKFEIGKSYPGIVATSAKLEIIEAYSIKILSRTAKTLKFELTDSRRDIVDLPMKHRLPKFPDGQQEIVYFTDYMGRQYRFFAKYSI